MSLSFLRTPALFIWGLLLSAWLTPTFAVASESYYVLIFAAQGFPNRPKHAHTFATFVRATGEGAAGTGAVLEHHTISWLPATGHVHLNHFRPEPGRNLGLDETLRLYRGSRATLALWGPYQIDRGLYERAVAQEARLNAGAMRYRAIDFGVRPHLACNCFHAISDIDETQPLLETGTAYGKAASQMVARHLQRWMIQPEVTHPWVAARLGLHADAIEHHDLAGPLEPKPFGVWRLMRATDRVLHHLRGE